LRELFHETSSQNEYFWPSAGLSLDNAAMIAGLAFHQYKDKGKGDPLDLDALTRIPF
jgi:N6-L-threonylcarbamoyladenine synthase